MISPKQVFTAHTFFRNLLEKSADKERKAKEGKKDGKRHHHHHEAHHCLAPRNSRIEQDSNTTDDDVCGEVMCHLRSSSSSSSDSTPAECAAQEKVHPHHRNSTKYRTSIASSHDSDYNNDNDNELHLLSDERVKTSEMRLRQLSSAKQRTSVTTSNDSGFSTDMGDEENEGESSINGKFDFEYSRKPYSLNTKFKIFFLSVFICVSVFSLALNGASVLDVVLMPLESVWTERGNGDTYDANGDAIESGSVKSGLGLTHKRASHDKTDGYKEPKTPWCPIIFEYFSIFMYFVFSEIRNCKTNSED